MSPQGKRAGSRDYVGIWQLYTLHTSMATYLHKWIWDPSFTIIWDTITADLVLHDYRIVQNFGWVKIFGELICNKYLVWKILANLSCFVKLSMAPCTPLCFESSVEVVVRGYHVTKMNGMRLLVRCCSILCNTEGKLVTGMTHMQ